MGTVEVETSESVNHLEARSQWAHLGRAQGSLLSLCAGGFGRHSPAAGDREPRPRLRDVEFPHHRRSDPLSHGAPHARRYPTVERASRHRDVEQARGSCTSPLRPIVSMPPVVPAKAPITAVAKPAAVAVKSPAAPVITRNQAALAAKAPKKAIVPVRTASAVAAKKKPAPVRKVAVAAARSAPARKAAPARPVKKRK